MNTTTGAPTGWAKMWARIPHIRPGDPCHDCGIGMVPASAAWQGPGKPPGMRVHGGHGLCGTCAHRRDRGEPGWRQTLRDGRR